VRLTSKRKILLHPVDIGGIDELLCAQGTAAFGILGRQKVPFAGTRAQDFAPRGYLKPLAHGFPRLNWFRSSHMILLNSIKRAVNLKSSALGIKRLFLIRLDISGDWLDAGNGIVAIVPYSLVNIRIE
jgi:hypothetical protein